MSRDWYLANGYEVSNLISDAVIQRAEREVREAYVQPIAGEAEGEVVDRAVGSLAFMLILQRNISATRAGAKLKTSVNSTDADAWQKLAQEARTCRLAIDNLRALPDAHKGAKVTDICRLYFTTNFFYD